MSNKMRSTFVSGYCPETNKETHIRVDFHVLPMTGKLEQECKPGPFYCAYANDNGCNHRNRQHLETWETGCPIYDRIVRAQQGY